MRRVLIVSPHFPPVNAPDMQRGRMALPYLRAHGWEPVVLAVDPTRVEGAVLDPLLESTYPADIEVLRVGGIRPQLTRKLGIGSLWLRCGRQVREAGERLLAARRFDLVFFTTTQFDAFSLGPRWLRRFGVPYVLDYQDPWVNEYYARTHTRPPGGRIKFWLSQVSARRREPAAVRDAAAIVSVSSSYGHDLIARYPDFDRTRVHHVPFGTAAADFETARHHRPANPLVPFGDGHVHLVYAGRCGPDMTHSLGLLFRALRLQRERAPADAARLRLHFIGTDYAPPPLGRYWARPIAERHGVADLVSEHPYRVPYFDALHYLARADALMVVGSSDPTYSASKIFPNLLARRPLITIVHEDSLMLDLARAQGFPCSYGFDHRIPPDDDAAERIRREWFANGGMRLLPPGDPAALAPHTADAMSGRLAEIFAAAARRPSTPSGPSA